MHLMKTASTTLLALALLAAPATATAGKVLLVEGDRVTRVDDPALPPASHTSLPRPPAGGAAAPARAAQGGGSVGAALQAAVTAGAISPAEQQGYAALYSEARSVRAALPRARAAQLDYVIRTLEAIARRNQLTPGRMPPMFLQLERNARYWRTGPTPRAGGRVVFGDSPVVFQYYPGRGLQIQPLGSFGKANALYNACRATSRRATCRRDALRSMLDWMLAISSPRGSFNTWEYFFRFGRGIPPWTSGLSQGTAVQALARGGELLSDASYTRAASSALGAFETSPPTGVRVRSAGGNHYLIYSFEPRLRVLNGFLQAVIGLHDYARISRDPRGQALFAAGDRAARRAVPRYDTGRWSLYSLGRRTVSDVGYHRLVRDFLRGLCTRTRGPVYCATADRFTRYLSNPPSRIGPQRVSARDPARAAQAVPPWPWRVSLRIVDGRRKLAFERIVAPPSTG